LNIGDRLKQLRKELDLTQEAFASRIGSVQNTITGYESGRRNPSAPVISLICREFNVNEEWLRNGTGEMFLPDANVEFDAMVKRYNLSYADQILIERYMNLNASARESIIDFLVDVVSKLNNDDSIFDGVPSTPEELEEMYPPVGEDKREGRLG